MRRRVAVIGAGVAGLSAAKALRDEGLEPIVFERDDDLGGLWRWRADRPDGGGPQYRSLRTNTSKERTAFSEMPFADELPDFPGWRAVLDYLEAYAMRFALRPLIRFSTEVERVERAGDGWRVVTSGGAHNVDAVVIGSGAFRAPHLPSLAGRERFRGDVLHSHDYSVPEPCSGRDVVVLGAGSSAADIAAELASHARSVTLAMRRPSWFVPRHLAGRPSDHRDTRVSRLLSPATRRRMLERAIRREYARRGFPDLDALIALPDLQRPDTPSTAGSDVIALVSEGRLRLAPAIAELEPAGVRFSDGRRTEADIVISATGYDFRFPFLAPDVARALAFTPQRLDCYKLVFPPDVPDLAFVAMCRVRGGVTTIAEMQSRWIARVFAGRAELPPPSAMRAEIAARWAHGGIGGADPMRAVMLEYLDDLAAMIGARPNLLRHPDWLFATVVASQYRSSR